MQDIIEFRSIWNISSLWHCSLLIQMYNSCQCFAGNIACPVKLHSYSSEQIVQLEKVEVSEPMQVEPMNCTYLIQENGSLHSFSTWFKWHEKLEDLSLSRCYSSPDELITRNWSQIYNTLLKKFITGANTNSCGEMPSSMNEWGPRKNIISNKEYTTQQWWHLMHVVGHPQIWIFWCSFCEYYLE